MPRGTRRLPDACVSFLADADLVIHAGDFMTAAVLADLEALGPPVVAVQGNVDDEELRQRLPVERTVEADGARIAVVHDAGPAKGRLARMRRRFGEADAVVFGHSHIPLHAEAEGFQIFNPGSPTERRRAPHHTMGLAEVRGGPGRVHADRTGLGSLRHGPGRPLRRHRRLRAVRAALPARHAGAARRRAAAVRLRRGHPAPADPVGGPDRAGGRVHHPLPRRPRARPAWHGQDLQPARARAPAHRPRPARAWSGCFGPSPR